MDWGTTLGPSSFVKDASVSGPREFVIATSTFLRAKTRASAVPILPEPIMAYFINESPVSQRVLSISKGYLFSRHPRPRQISGVNQSELRTSRIIWKQCHHPPAR